MRDTNPFIDIYNPTDKRTCNGCYKQLETKDGILEHNSFSCPACHRFYKYVHNIANAILLGLFFLFFGGILIFAFRNARKTD